VNQCTQIYPCESGDICDEVAATSSARKSLCKHVRVADTSPSTELLNTVNALAKQVADALRAAQSHDLDAALNPLGASVDAQQRCSPNAATVSSLLGASVMLLKHTAATLPARSIVSMNDLVATASELAALGMSDASLELDVGQQWVLLANDAGAHAAVFLDALLSPAASSSPAAAALYIREAQMQALLLKVYTSLQFDACVDTSINYSVTSLYAYTLRRFAISMSSFVRLSIQ
jgi:hypothetical protein